MLKRIGAAGVAAAGVSGTASARGWPGLDPGTELDVSDISGSVPLGEVLNEEQRAQFRGDPYRTTLTVDEDLDTVALPACCDCCLDDCNDCSCCRCDADC